MPCGARAWFSRRLRTRRGRRAPAADLRAGRRLAEARRGRTKIASRSQASPARRSRSCATPRSSLGGARQAIRAGHSMRQGRRSCSTRTMAIRVRSSIASPIATKRWDDLADAYEQGIAKIDGIGQRELLEALAKLHDKRRDDPRRALAAWDRLFQLDESDSRPLDEMDQLATLLSDWRRSSASSRSAQSYERRRRARQPVAPYRRGTRDMLDDPQGVDRRVRARPRARAGQRVHARQHDCALRGARTTRRAWSISIDGASSSAARTTRS